jgi:hypothetical protein
VPHGRKATGAKLIAGKLPVMRRQIHLP